MIMADVLQIVFLIVGSLIVFVSYWLAAEALFPSFVERARQQYESHAIRVTLLGLAVMAPAVVIGIVGLGKLANPVFKVAGVAVLGVPILMGLIGSAGLSQRIGRGLPSLVDEQQPWRRALRGGIVLAFTFLLPFIGWFFVLPWTVISGLGAAIAAIAAKEAA